MSRRGKPFASDGALPWVLLVGLLIPAACGDSGDGNDGTDNNATVAPICGNGEVEPGEECDDGPDNSDNLADACRSDCRSAECGDGVVDRDETCDEGSGNSDHEPDACRRNCLESRCGDGVLDTGEACDDGTDNSDSAANACRTTCEVAACGDGVLDRGQACFVYALALGYNGALPGNLNDDGLLDLLIPGFGDVTPAYQDASLIFEPLPYALMLEGGDLSVGDFDGDGDGDVVSGGLLAINEPSEFRSGRIYNVQADYPGSLDNMLFLRSETDASKTYLLTKHSGYGLLLRDLGAEGNPSTERAFLGWANPYGMRWMLEVGDLTGEGVPEVIGCGWDAGNGSCSLIKVLGSATGLALERAPLSNGALPLRVPLPGHSAGVLMCSNAAPYLSYWDWNSSLGTYEAIAMPAELAALPSTECYLAQTVEAPGPHPPLLIATDYNNDFPGLYLWNGSTSQYDATPLTLGDAVPGDFGIARTVLGHLNGDAYLDVAYVADRYNAGFHEVGVAYGGASGFTYQTLEADLDGFLSLTDVNGDGDDDLFVVTNFSPCAGATLYQGGSPSLVPVPVPLQCTFERMQWADLDGDGWKELLFDHNWNTLGVVKNVAGTLRTALRLEGPQGALDPIIRPDRVLAADVTGDGVDDLLAVQGLRLLVFSGLTSTGFDQVTETILPALLPRLRLGDVDGDGHLDLLGVTAVDYEGEPELHVLLNDPGALGTFDDQHVIATEFPLVRIATGDLNGDGRVDLAAIHGTASLVSVYLNEGGSTPSFATADRYLTQGPTAAVEVADMDGDGALDVIVTQPYDGNPAILWGTGTGTFGPAQQLVGMSGVSTVVPYDVNADGAPDLITKRAGVSGTGFTLMRNDP